jgi:hypothetical protein
MRFIPLTRALGHQTGLKVRLRDNKRRHRARQKEYTAELERKLRELQQEGVQATIEIQMSARKVAQENERLKKLLRHVGVEEEAINSWATENGDDDGENIDISLERLCLRRAAEGACDQAIADRCDPRETELLDLGAITAGVPLEQASPCCPTTMDPRNGKSSVRIENSDTANKSATLGK